MAVTELADIRSEEYTDEQLQEFAQQEEEKQQQRRQKEVDLMNAQLANREVDLMNAQLAKRRRTLDKHAQAMSVPIGSSSAIGLGPARLRGAQPRSSGDSNQLQVYNNPDSDDVVVSRVLVNRMLDHVLSLIHI